MVSGMPYHLIWLLKLAGDYLLSLLQSWLLRCEHIIALPFKIPDGDIVIMIGDWYTRNHTALRAALDSGKDLGMPDGVLINGKGPYQYNSTLVPDGINYETIKVDPGKTYRVRVHNVGVSTCLNFRIQNHNLLLAETEGYTTRKTRIRDRIL